MLTRRFLCFLSIKGTYIRACYVLGQENSEPLSSPPLRNGVLGNTYNAATPDNVQLVESVHNILRTQICCLLQGCNWGEVCSFLHVENSSSRVQVR
jgi:hypothetical protein